MIRGQKSESELSPQGIGTKEKINSLTRANASFWPCRRLFAARFTAMIVFGDSVCRDDAAHGPDYGGGRPPGDASAIATMETGDK
jgi:hypothetical protein